jgi:DNA invertase Pin-like site-specific DNA recombinase
MASKAGAVGSFKVVGYARVSTVGQNLAGQRAALKAAGCELIVEEKASGVKARPELAQLVEALVEGQRLVVSSVTRLGRSAAEIAATIDALDGRGVIIVCLKEGMDSSTIGGKLAMRIIASIAEFERELILERQADGIAAAKAEGKYTGRKAISKPELDRAVKLYLAKTEGFTFADAVAMSKVSERTFSRRLKEATKEG